MDINRVKALIFDTYGTTVDWRGSIMAEVEALCAEKGLAVEAEAFALAWRAGYQPKMNEIRSGARPWTDNDLLQREPGLAGRAGARLVVNTTVGLLGAWDPASRIGLEGHESDFGST